MMGDWSCGAQGQMSQRWRVWLWKSVEWQVWRALAISGIFREIVKPRSVAGIGRRGSPAGSALRRRPSAEWNWFLFFVLNAALKGPLFHGDVGCKSRPRKWRRSVCPYIFPIFSGFQTSTTEALSHGGAFILLSCLSDFQGTGSMQSLGQCGAWRAYTSRLIYSVSNV